VYAAAQLLSGTAASRTMKAEWHYSQRLDQAIVRHTADRVDLVYKALEINMSTDYGE